MRRIVVCALLLLLLLPARAQDRVYVITDRQAYLSGEEVFCSLFCADENGRPNGFSAVAYLELVSAEGTAAEAKIGLMDGRGAGSFRIPASTPTGKYRLMAYSARSAAVPEVCRILSIYNLYNSARVKDGVTLVPGDEYKPVFAPDLSEGVRLSVPARLRRGQAATLLVDGVSKPALLTVSVFHEDGLEEADGITLASFQKKVSAPRGNRPAEYEGEIIYATVEGEGTTAILSTAGDPSLVFLGKSDEKGRIRFFTGNIYGDRELVCEVLSEEGKPGHISIQSPFTHPEAGPLPSLVLSPAQRDALIGRKAALVSESAALDTLLSFLPKREDLFLEGITPLRYHLDDYNRFASVQEVCVEIIRELQFSRSRDGWTLRMVVTDGNNKRNYLQDNILVMMDGVVLPDHGMLADFDAMLLEDVFLYRQPVVLGGRSYNGVVNFVTKNNYVTSLRFPDNVRVVDFKGVSYPVACPGTVLHPEKDLRQLLFWHPALEIKAGEALHIPLSIPSYEGRFRAVAEGWTKDGTPVRAECFFVVY